jgi:hypothetical protein
MCSIIERTDIDRLLVPLFVGSLLSHRREGVTPSRTQSTNDCLQLFDHYDHMRKPFWGGRRPPSANYLSLCLQNVKDKTGETKHIQEKFFLILITMIYIHIIILLLCLHILWIVFSFLFPYTVVQVSKIQQIIFLRSPSLFDRSRWLSSAYFYSICAILSYSALSSLLYRRIYSTSIYTMISFIISSHVWTDTYHYYHYYTIYIHIYNKPAVMYIYKEE